MSPDVWEFIRSVLLIGAGSFFTWFFTRPKTNSEIKKLGAEAASEEVDTTKKTSDLIQEIQSENVTLYKRNTQLEKTNADQSSTIEIINARLETYRNQFEAATKQLNKLRGLAQQSPILEILDSEIETIGNVIARLQDAQSEAQKLRIEKEKTIQELMRITNRDLELKKPGQN